MAGEESNLMKTLKIRRIEDIRSLYNYKSVHLLHRFKKKIREYLTSSNGIILRAGNSDQVLQVN